MFRISVAVISLSLYLASCQFCDRNSKWRENNMIIYNTDNSYYLAAGQTSDDKIKRKRFVSVLSEALFYNSQSNQPTKLQRVKEAVANTRAQLVKPADALGGQMKTWFTIIRAIIDQPINDIKVSCKPDTEEADCLDKLRMQHQRNLARCKDYSRNLYVYEKTKDFIIDPQFYDFMDDVEEISDNSDEVALSYFTNIVLIKYPKMVEKGRGLFRLIVNATYPCNIGNLLLY